MAIFNRLLAAKNIELDSISKIFHFFFEVTSNFSKWLLFFYSKIFGNFNTEND